jgi:hypothetical protein
MAPQGMGPEWPTVMEYQISELRGLVTCYRSKLVMGLYLV